jgi:acetoin utilization protein AcuB
MTYGPITINISQTLSEAQSLMKEKQIRHLPIIDQEKIIGIISDRDINLVMSFALPSSHSLKVKDIVHSPVYTVHPETPIDQVVDEMASRHIGCAVVEDNHKIVGIFTVLDALKAVSDICHQRYHGG